jgi:hypothetical protein
MIKRIHSRIPMVRPTTPYTIVAVDVVTVRTIAWNGSKYFTLATDLCALRRHVYDSPRKNGAALHLKELIAFVFTQYGKQVAVLRIDGGGEYGGNELLALACEKGIKLQVTAPHSSVQNGAAEVSNHIVCTMGRKLIRHAGFPLQAWAEVLHAAVHILNLIPSQALDYRSPNEILDEWLERPPKNKSPLAHLRDYGCWCIALDYDVPRGEKFQIRGKLSRLIGYNDDASWRIYLHGSEKIISSKDVTFFEGQRLEDIILPNGSDLHDFLRQQNYDNEMLLPGEIFSVERNTKTLQPGGARAAAP